MPKQSVVCPFGKTDLRHQSRLKPAQILHLIDGDALAKMAIATGRQIRKGTSRHQKRTHRIQEAPASWWVETLPDFAGKNQFVRRVVSYQDRLETPRIGFVASNNKLLCFIDLEF